MKTPLALAALGAALFLGACTPQTQIVQPVVAVAPVAPRAVACDTRFRVVNNSSATVAQLFFSHSSLAGWGADQLGANVLPPGRVANYRAANAGNYDFRVVWSNGRAAELMRVNICAASQITITNSGLIAS
ncbi:MAG: hypothetical protein K2X11_07060 [Acetobacteraceae bacterium]|nr:hypothetical protein [Acetobacteraceae bacterium]